MPLVWGSLRLIFFYLLNYPQKIFKLAFRLFILAVALLGFASLPLKKGTLSLVYLPPISSF